MKPAPYYLMMLPEGYRERALANNPEPRIRNSVRASLLNFQWNSSREGKKFWDAVYSHLYIREVADAWTEDVIPLPKL